MLTELAWPRAHLVMDDFFAPAALAAVFRELPSLDRLLEPGLVRDLGHDGQSVFFEHERRKNKAVWIYDPSPTLRLFRERLWSEELASGFEQAREPLARRAVEVLLRLEVDDRDATHRPADVDGDRDGDGHQ